LQAGLTLPEGHSPIWQKGGDETMEMEKDVEAIVQTAKQTLTRFGAHPSMLFVRCEGGTHIVTFNDFGPEHEDKIRQMANAGVEAACKQPLGNLRYLIFVVEAWMGTPKKDGSYVQPSKDPKRKEMLMLTTLDVATNKQRVLMYQMIRNTRGELMQLNRFTEAWDSVESPLLPAFVAGYNIIKR
jgi:hypothetical protein